MIKRKIRICDLCNKEIDDITKYNVFKRNILFKDTASPHGIWECMYKHYICESCMEKLQAYCKKESN